MPTLSGRCLIDTNVLLYATLRDDPRHEAAMSVIEQARAGAFDMCVSVQNLAEMYPNLTGRKRRPPDSPQLARRKIESIARLRFVQLIPVDDSVILKTLELCEDYGVRRQDYFDMQIVAAMLINNVPTLATENATDFRVVKEIRTVNPFD